MSSEQIRTRILSFLSIIPVMVGIYIAGINTFFENDLRVIMTLSDYFTVISHRIGLLVMQTVVVVSYISYLVWIANAFSQRSRVRATLIMAVVLVIIALVLIWPTAKLSGLDISEWFDIRKNNIKLGLFQTLLILILATAYVIISIKNTADNDRIYLSRLMAFDLDIALLVIFFVPIFIDPARTRILIDNVPSSEMNSCLSEHAEQVQFIYAFERGVTIKTQNKIKLVSYDCIKSVEPK